MSCRICCFYCAGQFLGALVGAAVAAHVLGGALGNAAVHYAATAPGALRRRRRVRCRGNHLFRFDELYSVRLGARESPSIHTLLWRCFGCCMYSVRIATIGRQCKPGTHVRAGHFRQLLAAVWIYFTAPPFGMLATAEVFLILRGGVGPFCAKLDHANRKRCMFHHEYRTVFTLFG